MKIIFNKSGEYRNGRFVTEVTEADIKNEKIFNIHDANAIVYVDKEYAVRPKVEQPPALITLEDVNKMSVAELKDYASKNEIDLGEATKKDDILEVVAKTFEKK